MNLIQQANFLENVPKDQLAQMSQDPNGQFPPFLVLTEIQRRTMNEQNYKAMQEQPTTTVAEEVVGNFMQPQLAQNQSQGLQGGTPQSVTPLPDYNISAGLSGVPTAPMQMAASGGLTGYAAGDRTALNESFKNRFFDVYGRKVLGGYSEDAADLYNQVSNSPIAQQATVLAGEIYPLIRKSDKSLVYKEPDYDAQRQLIEASLSPNYKEYVNKLDIDDSFKSMLLKEVEQEIPSGISGIAPAPAPTPAPTPAPAISADLGSIANVPVNVPIDKKRKTTNDLYNEAMEDYEPTLIESPYKPSERVEFPEIPTDSRDYFKVSDEDRDRELDVFALAGLAQAVGGAKNLAEFGSSTADVALGLQKVKKGQRQDQRTVADLEFKDAQNTYAMEAARSELLNKAFRADNVAEQNAIIEVLKLNYNKEGKDGERIMTGIRNEALLAQIDATNNAQLKPFVTGFMTELNTLKEKMAQTRSEDEDARISELEGLINQLLFNATSRAGVDLQRILQDAGAVFD